jgi:benzodiazapine receptor
VISRIFVRISNFKPEHEMNRDTARQYVNLLAMLGALTVNVLANALPLNGLNTGEISDRFKVFFVPAGYVFSIWGIIYIGWIAFLIFQFRPGQKAAPRMRALGYWFALSCIFNAAWLFCWHYERFDVSVVVMLSLLVTLILSYRRLDVGRSRVGTAERWCVDIPFSLYLGWVSVAAIANITGFLYSLNWDGFGISPQVWAVIMLAIASVLGLLMARLRMDAAYLFVFVWAFSGIAIKQAATPLVAIAAWAAAGLALALAILSILRRNRLAAS